MSQTFIDPSAQAGGSYGLQYRHCRFKERLHRKSGATMYSQRLIHKCREGLR
ncbi:MAG: hypothetical protein ACYCT3_06915 [Acidiferrobacter sp.]